MSKFVVDIHGEIEGDYEIIKKYEEQQMNNQEYNCNRVIIKDKDGKVLGDALYDKSRMLIFTGMMTVDYAKHIGLEIIESEEKIE